MQHSLSHAPLIGLRPLLGFCFGACLALIIALSMFAWNEYTIMRQQAARLAQQEIQLQAQETIIEQHQSRLELLETWRQSCRPLVAIAGTEALACPRSESLR